MTSTTSTLAGPPDANHEKTTSRTPSLRDESNKLDNDTTDVESTLAKKEVNENTDVESVLEPSEDEYPQGTRLVFVVVALVLSIFLVALDMVSTGRSSRSAASQKKKKKHVPPS